MASSDSKGPFEKFTVGITDWPYYFIVKVEPNHGSANDRKAIPQMKFIEDAIREKLDRERQP